MNIEVLFALILGLLVGSFLNVVIYRLPVMMENDWTQFSKEHLGLIQENDPQPEKFNLMTPPSRCGNCGSPVRPWQNMPIISWLILRGKCASCHTPISIRYPLVELLTGLLFALVAWQYGWSPITVWGCLFTAFVIALTFIDADTQYLPDQLTMPLIWLGFLFNWHTGFISLEQAMLGAVVGYMSLWILSNAYKLWRGVDGMGGGDFKLLAAVGAWTGLQNLAVIVLMAACVGIVAGLIKRVAKQQPMAFGPCLAIAGWIVFVWHDKVLYGVNWWLHKSGF
ncbi:prepilin peptidase [Alysiella filiformis]|uniref:Prepilin leader peptidase/N-methyltransferase n=1 Tax=Alysiella filiformis DSM 16848 TaxID=1120981 RepID=A0A286EG00_9NEIS|nr:A24 family peptidase [Alysiella filiformis]QMT31227.1 prepilin peptidase [Alysiella filiformis]UBQ55773.1 A24 family peptidase [Alysiella filiformis DSM 16848]SOD69855.1 type 4 prepilin peptidase 1 . Aspartic peptidase. MEROPS family A24A [Alysiella filiformis DSM 16848]